MKIIFTFFIAIILSFNNQLKAQSDFKITVYEPYWSSPSGYYVELKIGMLIKNTGTEEGWCEDLRKLVLVCVPEYKISDIQFLDYAEISKTLKPGQYVSGFIKYKVPKDADSLTLIFDDEDNNSRKFISRSYNIVQLNLTDERYHEAISEAEKQERSGEYYKAILSYKLALSLNSAERKELSRKISELYTQIGEKEFFNKKYEKALDYYKSSLTFNSENEKSRSSISLIYETLGDQKFSNLLFTEAKSFYDSSLVYSHSPKIENKLADLKKREDKIKNDKIEFLKKEKIERELQELNEPNVGVSLNAKVGMADTEFGTKSLPLVSLELQIPIKLMTEKKSKICVFMNNSVGYDYLYLKQNSQDFQNFTRLNTTRYSIDIQPKGIGNVNYVGGIGISLLNKYFIPMISVNYGILMQTILDGEITDKNINKKFANETAFGNGLYIKASFVFGKTSHLGLGYTYSNVDFNGDYEFNKYNLTTHSLTISYINF
ncbi:MAG: hypothetical protein K1X86_16055 [Ignavibacteria bacterium]|nr:hypothetical protein [Ignavibacteria bacterium]